MLRSFRAIRSYWSNNQAPTGNVHYSNQQNSTHIQTPQSSNMNDVSMMDWQPTTPNSSSTEHNPYPEGYMPGGWPITSPQDYSQILGPRPPFPQSLESVKRVCLGIDTTTQSTVRNIANIGRAWMHASISGASAVVVRPAYFVVRQHQRAHPRETRRPAPQLSTSPWRRAITREGRGNRFRQQNSTSPILGNTFAINGIPIPFQNEQQQHHAQSESDYLPYWTSINVPSYTTYSNGQQENRMYQEQPNQQEAQNQRRHTTPPRDSMTGVPFPSILPTIRKKENREFKIPISFPANKNSSANNEQVSATQATTAVISSSHQESPTLPSIETSPPGALSAGFASSVAEANEVPINTHSLMGEEESELGSPDNVDLLTPPPIRFRQIRAVQSFSSPTSVKAPSDVKPPSKSPDKSEISSTYGLSPDTYSHIQIPNSSPVPEDTTMQTVSDTSSTYGMPPDSYSFMRAQQESEDEDTNTARKSLSKARKSFTPKQSSSKKSVKFVDEISHEIVADSVEEPLDTTAQKSPPVPDQASTMASDIEMSETRSSATVLTDTNPTDPETTKTKSSETKTPEKNKPEVKTPEKNVPEIKTPNVKILAPLIGKPVNDSPKEKRSSEHQPLAKTPEQKFAELSLNDGCVRDQPTPKASPHSSEKGHRLTRAEKKRLEAQQELLNYEIAPLSDEWEIKVKEALKNGHKKLKASDLTRVVPIAPGRGTDNWLNDEVINDYLSLVVAHGKKNDRESQSPSHHAFNSFFYSNLSQKGYEGVKRWASRAKIGGKSLLHTELIFIPINSGMHWTLCVVSGTRRTITYYNSMRGSGKAHVDAVLEWVKGELGKSFDQTEWTLNAAGESPQQQNMDDCGVFTITSARQIMLGFTPMSYRPDQIKMQRKRIVAELVNGELIKSVLQ